jgi:activator of the mannose operon, transcriptional antiterminator
MNKRQKEILQILFIHDEGVLHIKVLSEELDCAEKTVRNDLNRLEEFLLEIKKSLLDLLQPALSVG